MIKGHSYGLGLIEYGYGFGRKEGRKHEGPWDLEQASMGRTRLGCFWVYMNWWRDWVMELR